MRRVNAITFLNSFVSGALTMLIPLLLLAQNVDLADIGVVLSVLPLVFLVARLLFAALADYIGWSHVFLLLNWPTAVASTLVYYFASSLPVFVAGKVFEGFRESSYWAVSRTAIFKLSPKREGNEATKNNAIIWLATAVGSLAAGIGIAGIGFSSTLAILFIASLAIGIPAVTLWRSSRRNAIPKTENLLAPLNPRGRPPKFWIASVALMFNSLAIYPLVSLILPVFMNQQLSYDYLSIGLLFMLYNVVSALATFVSLRKPPSTERAASLTMVSVVASSFLAISGFLFVAFLVALAIVRGFGISYFEHAVAKVAKDSSNVCVDVGLLHVPMRFAEFFSVLASGFAIAYLGYTPVFLATGICYGLFLWLSLRVLKLPNTN